LENALWSGQCTCGRGSGPSFSEQHPALICAVHCYFFRESRSDSNDTTTLRNVAIGSLQASDFSVHAA
jgi:hypothetical protein